MTEKGLIAIAGVLVCVGTLAHYTTRERTYRVPSLHGLDVYVPASELDKVTPLGWAMMLDMNGDAATQEAYARQCSKDPALATSVEHLFDTKAMIESARTRRRLR